MQEFSPQQILIVASRAVCGCSVVSVAIYAVAHLQRAYLLNFFHRPYIAMTSSAHCRLRDAVPLREEPDVRLMYEMHMVRNSMHAHPVYRAFVLHDHLAQLLYLRQVVAHNLVTGQAQSGRWYRRRRALGNIAMTESAVHPKVFDMCGMRKRDRLVRPLGIPEDHRPAQPRRYHKSQSQRRNN